MVKDFIQIWKTDKKQFIKLIGEGIAIAAMLYAIIVIFYILQP